MLDLLIKIQENRQIIKNSTKDSISSKFIVNMKRIKKEFEREKKRYLELKQKFVQLENKIKNIENKVNIIKQEIRDNETKLYSNLKYDLKMMESLERSIEMKKNDIKDLEDKSFELLCDEDEILKTKEKSRSVLVGLRNDFYMYKKGYSDELSKMEKDTERAKKDIEELENKIPEKLLNKFNEISDIKGTGAAELYKGVCQGCRMKVSAITLDNINKNNEIVCCDNCGRIVYCNYER